MRGLPLAVAGVDVGLFEEEAVARGRGVGGDDGDSSAHGPPHDGATRHPKTLHELCHHGALLVHAEVPEIIREVAVAVAHEVWHDDAKARELRRLRGGAERLLVAAAAVDEHEVFVAWATAVGK